MHCKRNLEDLDEIWMLFLHGCIVRSHCVYVTEECDSIYYNATGASLTLIVFVKREKRERGKCKKFAKDSTWQTRHVFSASEMHYNLSGW
jgi:hypothetical protein